MIEYHADDYGLYPQQSKLIIDCIKNGVLNGLSIMPNSQYIDECMNLLKPFEEKLQYTIHLNLVEGYCLSNKKDVNLLVNEDGIFNISFIKLLLASFSVKRKLYKEQIKKELKNQILNVKKYFDNKELRLDSHVHYHQIPVVFDSIIEIIQEEKLNVSYIRMPEEKISFYKPIKSFSNFKGINIIKVLVLNSLVKYNKLRYKKILLKYKEKLFSGVACSGNMNINNTSIILNNYKKSKYNNKDIEVLFHPGGVYSDEEIKKITSKDDLNFLTNEARISEGKTLIKLKEKSMME